MKMWKLRNNKLYFPPFINKHVLLFLHFIYLFSLLKAYQNPYDNPYFSKTFPVVIIHSCFFSLSYIKVTANLTKVYPKDEDAPAGGVDDMTKLSYLHEPGVLQNLSSRYQLNEIYVRWIQFELEFIFDPCSSMQESKPLQFCAILSHNISYFDVMTDLYWKHSYCDKSFSKTSSLV